MKNMFSRDGELCEHPGKPQFIGVLMGDSGFTKNTIRREFSARLGWEFVEGNEYLTQDKIRKVAAGSPLK